MSSCGVCIVTPAIVLSKICSSEPAYLATSVLVPPTGGCQLTEYRQTKYEIDDVLSNPSTGVRFFGL